MMIIADNNSNINNTHGRNSNNINNKGIARSSDENGRKPEQTNMKLVRPSLDVPHAHDEVEMLTFWCLYKVCEQLKLVMADSRSIRLV